MRQQILEVLSHDEWTTWPELFEAVEGSYTAVNSAVVRMRKKKLIETHPEGHWPGQPARYRLR